MILASQIAITQSDGSPKPMNQTPKCFPPEKRIYINNALIFDGAFNDVGHTKY